MWSEVYLKRSIDLTIQVGIYKNVDHTPAVMHINRMGRGKGNSKAPKESQVLHQVAKKQERVRD